MEIHDLLKFWVNQKHYTTNLYEKFIFCKIVTICILRKDVKILIFDCKIYY